MSGGHGMVDHVLLTRFNLPSGGVEARIRASETWLRDRWELFEKYCVPAVAAQTSKAYRWLIYFDPESPQWLREAMARYVSGGLFTAIFRVDVPRAALLGDLHAVAGSDSTGLITTNLDNDDALAVDFVARVRGAADTSSRHAIYLVNGLIKAPQGLYAHTDRNNAFCSVAEPWEEPRTCWSDWHNRLRRNMPVVEVDGAPGWLQVVHGRNVSNRVRGRLVRPEPWRSQFAAGILDDVETPARSRLVLDRILTGPYRVGRDATRSGLRMAAVAVLGKQGAQNLRARLRP